MLEPGEFLLVIYTAEDVLWRIGYNVQPMLQGDARVCSPNRRSLHTDGPGHWLCIESSAYKCRRCCSYIGRPRDILYERWASCASRSPGRNCHAICGWRLGARHTPQPKIGSFNGLPLIHAEHPVDHGQAFDRVEISHPPNRDSMLPRNFLSESQQPQQARGLG